jgi:hypothetical protein
MKKIKFHNSGLIREFSDEAAHAYVKAGTGKIHEEEDNKIEQKEEKQVVKTKEAKQSAKKTK